MDLIFDRRTKNTELNNILDSIAGGVVTYCVSDILQITYCSKKVADKLGYPQEILNIADKLDIFNYIHPSDLEIVKEVLWSVIYT